MKKGDLLLILAVVLIGVALWLGHSTGYDKGYTQGFYGAERDLFNGNGQEDHEWYEQLVENDTFLEWLKDNDYILLH
ncbi:MAG: hypothetical protein Q4A39_01500 [Eubacteriales bacterium]|nr:hypothetical protein [Eubacteriales bacterium]